jgi:hypothetical protein
MIIQIRQFVYDIYNLLVKINEFFSFFLSYFFTEANICIVYTAKNDIFPSEDDFSIVYLNRTQNIIKCYKLTINKSILGNFLIGVFSLMQCECVRTYITFD